MFHFLFVNAIKSFIYAEYAVKKKKYYLILYCTNTLKLLVYKIVLHTKLAHQTKKEERPFDRKLNIT